MKHSIAIFGEAEKGQLQKPYHCQSLEELSCYLGNPPEDSQGLFLAIQSLLYNYQTLFFRVEQEGFSQKDYLFGLTYLKKESIPIKVLAIPGVSDKNILKQASSICSLNQSILISNEKDLYDYLTL